MFLKLVGLRFSSPTLPEPDKGYLSNFSKAESGDVLIDDAGNVITFGLIGVPFNAPPADPTLALGETKLWFEISTGTVWSKTKDLSGTVFTADLGAGGVAGTDFMTKSVYDTNNDGVVNAADSLVGTSGTTTADTVAGHIADGSIHAAIADLVTSTSSLWSSQKISNSLGAISTTIAGLTDTNVGTLTAGEMLVWTGTEWVNAPLVSTGPLTVSYDTLLDNIVLAASDTINGLADVDTTGIATGDILVWTGTELQKTTINSNGNISISYDPVLKTLTLDTVVLPAV